VDLEDLPLEERIWIVLSTSHCLAALGRRAGRISELFRSQTSRRIPVAAVAREYLGVSVRQIWRWRKLGLFGAVRQGKARGLERKAVLEFLQVLAEADQQHRDVGFRVRLPGRPRTAQKKIRHAVGAGLLKQRLDPAGFAAAAGVSRSSVWRAINRGQLEYYRPSPHRVILGKKPKRPLTKK